MSSKENILYSLDGTAEVETIKIANELTDLEASKLAIRIEKEISNFKGPILITTISKLRKTEDALSFKFRLAVEIWNSIGLKTIHTISPYR